MTIESVIADLTTATTTLTASVMFKKSQLDAAVLAAQTGPIPSVVSANGVSGTASGNTITLSLGAITHLQ